MKVRGAVAVFNLLCAVGGLGTPVRGWAQEPTDGRTYGTATKTFASLSPWHFVPQDSTLTFQLNSTEIGLTISRTNVSGGNLFIGPLHLPEGALVTEMEAVFCDTNPDREFHSYLV